MPLTKKGQKVLAALKKEYGDKKGEEVFYAGANKGRFSGVVADQAKKKREHKRL
jgi:hypothetical protein